MKRTILSLMILAMSAGGATSVLAGDSQKETEQMKRSNSTSKESGTPALPATTMSKDAPTAVVPGAGAPATAGGEYKAAQNRVQEQFKTAKAQCDLMSGEALTSCIAEAQSERTKALSRVDLQWGAGDKSKNKTGATEDSGRSAQVGGAPDTRASSKQRNGDQLAKVNPVDASGSASTGKSEYAAATDQAQTVFRDAKVKCEALQGAANGSCIAEAKSVRSAAFDVALSAWDSEAMTALPDTGALERSNRGMDAQGGMKPDAENPQQSPSGSTSR